jgi:carbamoyl-phosphate synthase large subunit
VSEGSPHIVDLIEQGSIHLILNTPLGRRSRDDTQDVRAAAIRCNVPLLTTLSAAAAATNGIKALQDKALKVKSLQVHHKLTPAPA